MKNLPNLPNQITISRLILSGVFFTLLGLLDQKHGRALYTAQPVPANCTLLLDLSVAVFVLTAATDFLDGYLARRWGMISTFGRIADPFVDKVFICGSFIFLIPISPLVQPWYVVVVIMREFLVSGLRSFLEGKGVAFGAGLGGKLKMICQSVTVPSVLLYRAHLVDFAPARWTVIVLLGASLVFTISSSVEYVRRAVGHLHR